MARAFTLARGATNTQPGGRRLQVGMEAAASAGCWGGRRCHSPEGPSLRPTLRPGRLEAHPGQGHASDRAGETQGAPSHVMKIYALTREFTWPRINNVNQRIGKRNYCFSPKAAGIDHS